jgi:hypothetical protein
LRSIHQEVPDHCIVSNERLVFRIIRNTLITKIQNGHARAWDREFQKALFLKVSVLSSKDSSFAAFRITMNGGRHDGRKAPIKQRHTTCRGRGWPTEGPPAALQRVRCTANRKKAERCLSGAFFGYFLSPHERK